MRYVYLLESPSSPPRRYIGITDDLKRRLGDHNRGKVPHTSHLHPWHLGAYTAFASAPRATVFERYLKSGSGHAFASRHLW